MNMRIDQALSYMTPTTLVAFIGDLSATIDAGLDKDDAETCVDRTIPNKPDVYADNADIWEMDFDRS